MHDEFATVLSRLVLALGIGLLIGLERGWRTRDARPGSRTAGVRTFAISGLLGGLTAALVRVGDGAPNLGGSVLIGAVFMAFAAVMALFGREENRAAGVYSATNTVSALLAFMLGVYAVLGNVRVAGAAAVAAVGVLIVREELHEWVKKITLDEFQSLLVLLAMTFIALPIVPDGAFGPFGGVNLRQIWLIAIVLASVSFAGFVAVRALGERRGVLLASALGGLVSSTAVIFANARAAAAGAGSARVLAAGVALATTVSLLRVMAIVAVLQPVLLIHVAPALLAAALAAIGFTLVAMRAGDAATMAPAAAQFRNPFGFFSVVAMAASMGAVMLFGRVLNQVFGASGAVIGASISGVFDVDAMTVAITQLVPQALTEGSATWAILAGVASATLGKVAIGSIIGRGRFALLLLPMAVGCVAAGVAAKWLFGIFGG